MNGKIIFFHPEEDFVYQIAKSFCKVVYQKTGYGLVVEVESSEDLDHIPEDALQNEYPKVVFNIDDFPIRFSSEDDLVGQQIEIPESTVEITNEDGEIEEFFYTNLALKEEDLETYNNTLSFDKKEEVLCLKWEGKVDDFTDENSDRSIHFELYCPLIKKAIEIDED